MPWEPKTKTITFRVTAEKDKLLRELSDKSGMKLARFMDELLVESWLELYKTNEKLMNAILKTKK